MNYNEAKQLILGSNKELSYSRIKSSKFSIVIGDGKIFIEDTKHNIPQSPLAERISIRFTSYKDTILALKLRSGGSWRSSMVNEITPISLEEWDRIMCLESLDCTGKIINVRNVVRDTNLGMVEWELCYVEE